MPCVAALFSLKLHCLNSSTSSNRLLVEKRQVLMDIIYTINIQKLTLSDYQEPSFIQNTMTATIIPFQWYCMSVSFNSFFFHFYLFLDALFFIILPNFIKRNFRKIRILQPIKIKVKKVAFKIVWIFIFVFVHVSPSERAFVAFKKNYSVMNIK